ncbi:hypothetical protein [Mycoplasma struthionis]|uniref:DUF1934 domain-containing protein n=1 Tax=Mycoplasma struthionis TaxID=538220 RepID=A0A502M9I9_9MOLU|nr:hypothetical protein [Mycoplasma struthionis]TPI02529.1 hypothetical protein FJM01_00555 [Mycoplasma struthionis]
MYLKYLLLSSNQNIEPSFESDYLEYTEETEGEFIVIKYKDLENNEASLRVSNNEAQIIFNGNKMDLALKRKVSNTFYFGEIKITFDCFLTSIVVKNKIIELNYDLLQNDTIIVSNIARFEFYKEKGGQLK